MPVVVIVRDATLGGDLRRGGLQLLQADDVGPIALQPLAQLRGAGANAVHVPGRDFHVGMISPLTRRGRPRTIPISYETIWLCSRRDLCRPRRPDAPSDPGAVGGRRSDGHGAGRAVRHEPAGDLQAPQGSGARRLDHPGPGGAAPAPQARAAAARRGDRLDRALPQDLGGELQAPRRRPGGAEGQAEEDRGRTDRGHKTQAEEKETEMTKTAAMKVTTPSDRELVMTRMFVTPRGMVFDALTQPDLVRRWLLGPPGWTMPVCEIDLRIGGPYRYVWQNADGREIGVGGAFKESVRASRIVASVL